MSELKKVTFETGEPILGFFDTEAIWQRPDDVYRYWLKDLFDKSKPCHFLIGIGFYGYIENGYIVSAECIEDAVNILIDWMDENQPRMLFSDDDLEDFKKEAEERNLELEDYLCDYFAGGNKCYRYIASDNIYITEMKINENESTDDVIILTEL